MNLLLTIKNNEYKQNLESLIRVKLQKLNKHVNNEMKVSWKYFSEKNQHVSEVKISGFHGPEIKARANSNNMFKVIDLAVSKLDKQLRKKNGLKRAKGFKRLDEHLLGNDEVYS